MKKYNLLMCLLVVGCASQITSDGIETATELCEMNKGILSLDAVGGWAVANTFVLKCKNGAEFKIVGNEVKT